MQYRLPVSEVYEFNILTVQHVSVLRITDVNLSTRGCPHTRRWDLKISDCKVYFIWADILSPHYFVAVNYKPFSTLHIPLSWLIHVYPHPPSHVLLDENSPRERPTSLKGSLLSFSENSPTFGEKVQISDRFALQQTFFYLQRLSFFVLLSECQLRLCLMFLLIENTSAVAEHIYFKSKCLWL